MTAPGWFHAQGDPGGTQRYWNGTQWQGDAVTPPAKPNEPALTALAPAALVSAALVSAAVTYPHGVGGTAGPLEMKL